jgi:MarR family transcriptional regulator, organic hydroperoxide resistance regulator
MATRSQAKGATRLAHLIRAVHAGFYRGLQTRLAERGFKMGHWVFLRILWQDDNLTQRELSIRAGLRDPTTFAAVKAMEKLGLIRRKINPKNRREVRVSLTKRGRELERPLLALALEMNELAVRGLDRTTMRVVTKALETIIRNFDEVEEQRIEKKASGIRKRSLLKMYSKLDD